MKRIDMKKFLLIITLLFAFCININFPVFADDKFDFSNIGFHKKSDIEPAVQIKQIFDNLSSREWHPCSAAEVTILTV